MQIKLVRQNLLVIHKKMISILRKSSLKFMAIEYTYLQYYRLGCAANVNTSLLYTTDILWSENWVIALGLIYIYDPDRSRIQNFLFYISTYIVHSTEFRAPTAIASLLVYLSYIFSISNFKAPPLMTFEFRCRPMYYSTIAASSSQVYMLRHSCPIPAPSQSPALTNLCMVTFFNGNSTT